MSKTNICFFCSLPSLNTGMPLSTLKLIRAVSNDSSFNVHVVLPGKGEFSKSLQDQPVKINIIPFRRVRSIVHLKDFINFILKYPFSLISFSAYLKKNNINIIHFSDIIDSPFFPGILFTKASALAHLRTDVNRLPIKLLYRALAHLFLKKIICVSQNVMNNIGISNKHSVVIYNPGPDMDLFNRDNVIKDEYIKEKSSKRINICCIGSLVHVKGYTSVIRTALILNREHPGRFSFFIAGGTRKGHYAYKKKLDTAVVKNNLQDTLFFLGEKRHDEIPSILAACDIFLHLPHYQEPFAGVVLEAMAMSLPVVAFDSGGTKECFIDNESGFLVEQFNCRQASDRILMLADNPELRKKTGELARKHLVQTFSVDKHADEMKKIYNSLVEQKE